MKNLSQAVEVAVFVREYLRTNNLLNKPSSEELTESYERISEQLKSLPKFK